MSESANAPLGIRFSFEAEGDEPSGPGEAEPGQKEGAAPPTSRAPQPAIRTVDRAARPPGEAAAADVNRLMEAVGLLAVPAVDVLVTTPQGLWASVQAGHPIVIGRSDRDAHLAIADPSVSRRHCQIHRESEREVLVEDLASANGSWIHRSDQRVAIDAGRPVRLENGDWIGSGPDVYLAYVTIEPRSGGQQPA